MKTITKAIFIMLLIIASVGIYWSIFRYYNYIYGTGVDESYHAKIPTFYNVDTYSPSDLRIINSLSDAQNDMGIDLRSTDASTCNLSENFNPEELIFDDSTIWPTDVPSEFDPQLMMETGANPGLGIRELHKLSLALIAPEG